LLLLLLVLQALCGAVSRGDMPQLGNLLRAGADANAADYDRRTPLHVAAAESNLPAVRGAGMMGRAQFRVQG
jgi:ankyrin repeat protein